LTVPGELLKGFYSFSAYDFLRQNLAYIIILAIFSIWKGPEPGWKAPNPLK
jgi:hypothetical protein